MKTRFAMSTVCQAICGLFLFLCCSTAFGQDSQAKDLYKIGMQALNTMPHNMGRERNIHLAAAKQNLSQCFMQLKTPMTAYALAFVYALLEDSANAKIFAETALNLEPKLTSPYSSEAQKILDWADAAQGGSVDVSMHAAPASEAMEYVFKTYPMPNLP